MSYQQMFYVAENDPTADPMVLQQYKYVTNDHEYITNDHEYVTNDHEYVTNDHEESVVTEEQNENVGKDFTWDRRATKLLLSCYSEIKEAFRDPKIKKRDLWTKIQQKFRKENYSNITVDALDRKWRNLKKRYTTIRDTKKKTGRGRISWEYFDDFEEIYCEDRTINFPPTISFSNYITTANSQPSCLRDRDSNEETTEVMEKSVPDKTKASHMRGLYGLRKRLLEIEEKRVEEIKQLRLSIEKNNEIQIQRNEILKQLYEKL